MRDQCTPDIETLDRLCRLANREAFALFEERATCIVTSAAVRDVLEHLAIPADLMRVEAAHFGASSAVVLGSDGDGTRRPAASPGMWRGHVAVIAAGRILLDPTLDQIESCQPFTAEITEEWLRGGTSLWWVDGQRTPAFSASRQPTTRYRAFPGRGGWKSAPDFRPSRRRALVSAILSAWQG